MSSFENPVLNKMADFLQMTFLFGSGNGLAPAGAKPLPEPIMIQFNMRQQALVC